MRWPLFLMRLLSNRVTTRRSWRKLKQIAITSCSRSEKAVSDRQTPGVLIPKLRSEVKVNVGAANSAGLRKDDVHWGAVSGSHLVRSSAGTPMRRGSACPSLQLQPAI